MVISSGRLSRHEDDVAALKQIHPIDAVVAGYGIELRQQGRALVGRCPFHADSGRPNLHLYRDTQSFCCYRCGAAGDVLTFIMRAEQIAFREAVNRLGGAPLGPLRAVPPAPPRPAPPAIDERAPEELAVLQAATTLYHQRLLADPSALAYVTGRGIDRDTIAQWRIGYAAGDQLAAYLRWRGLPFSTALHVGLLTRGGREFLDGRIVIPEIREQQAMWLCGRTLPSASPPEERSTVPTSALPSSQDQVTGAGHGPPKYLGLPGSKPLLGWQEAARSSSVCLVEGGFDVLTLRMWGYPVLGLLGTDVRQDRLAELRRFQRVFIILDNDDAGVAATVKLHDAIGPTAVPVALPRDFKDVAELAPRADGPTIFAAALLESVGSMIPRPDGSRRDAGQPSSAVAAAD